MLKEIRKNQLLCDVDCEADNECKETVVRQ